MAAQQKGDFIQRLASNTVLTIRHSHNFVMGAFRPKYLVSVETLESPTLLALQQRLAGRKELEAWDQKLQKHLSVWPSGQEQVELPQGQAERLARANPAVSAGSGLAPNFHDREHVKTESAPTGQLRPLDQRAECIRSLFGNCCRGGHASYLVEPARQLCPWPRSGISTAFQSPT